MATLKQNKSNSICHPLSSDRGDISIAKVKFTFELPGGYYTIKIKRLKSYFTNMTFNN